MRTILHLSDLHLAREPAPGGPSAQTRDEIRPDLVAVSGDLTQRARSRQFQEAREFLDALPQPQIVVRESRCPSANPFTRFLSHSTNFVVNHR